MTNFASASYPIDGSSILFLSQMAPDHTNIFRFSVTLRQKVSPELLQQAADRVYSRFPTIFARFQPTPFTYEMIPLSQAPRVRQDPGLLLTMGQEEFQSCAYRIFYEDYKITIELFHALTDGFGAIASLKALLGEYFYLGYGLSTPEREQILLDDSYQEAELRDAYPEYTGDTITVLPRKVAYRLPGPKPSKDIFMEMLSVSTQALLGRARAHGVSVTSLLSCLMAESVMEIQETHQAGKKHQPVRLMVPVDLRRKFPSKTLRNFVLYALPTLEPEEGKLPFPERLRRIQQQMNHYTDKNLMAAQITRNVRIQKNPLFRWLPRQGKRSLMLLSNRIFGETNSSITLTNLGPVTLSDALKEQIANIEVHLTPRRRSPYNCGLISCGDVTNISITHFGSQPQLEERFFGKIKALLDTPLAP